MTVITEEELRVRMRMKVPSDCRVCGLEENVEVSRLGRGEVNVECYFFQNEVVFL